MKTPEQYWNLGYKMVVEAIPDEDGGGLSATMPELGEYAFVGDGESPEEAIASLKSVFCTIVGEYIQSNKPFPLPKKKPAYSGKFLARITPALHERLVSQAEEQGVSLNQFVTECLAASSVEQCVIKNIESHFAVANDLLVKTSVVSVELPPNPHHISTSEATWGYQ
ncbi:MAG: toxin-antitoxin system HicB family antitoxin [Desulfovibrionaceae bacterium]|nr:toxin-antitoxin system HicB family antitoxin [Desulfovibrionaceae bacterium]